MDEVLSSIVVFGCVIAGAGLGMVLGHFLPDHQRSDASRDVVRMTGGIVATLSALVLGLLVSSAKSNYDALEQTVRGSAARIVMLDQALASYGTEASALRGELRNALGAAVKAISPEDGTRPSKRGDPRVGLMIINLQRGITDLEPRARRQELLQARALQGVDELMQARLLALELTAQPVKPLFFAMVILWLVFVFVGFGFLAPRSASAVVALVAGAFSVAGAVFLILELGSSPLSGMIAISTDPLRHVLAQITAAAS